MTRLAFSSLLSIIVAVTSAASARANVATFFDSKDPSATRIMFVGNSLTFANELPLVLGCLINEHNSQAKMKITEVSAPNLTLRQHWNSGEAASTINNQSPPWTYVVLQEQSGRPLNNPEEMFTDIANFDAIIRRAGSRTVLFMTWSDDNRPEVQNALTQRYVQAASQYHTMLAGVGEAFRLAKAQLPNLSLYSDGHHPSQAGTYLAACVFYAKLLGLNPEGLPERLLFQDQDTEKIYMVADLTHDQAKTLQRIAWQIARAY